MTRSADTGARSRVFISHGRADVEEARRLKTGLAKSGLTGWLAPDDMVGRESWAGELNTEIARCDSFVVLIGSTTLASKHVEREVTLAVEHDRLIVPVLIEQIRLTGPLAYLLATRHWVEAIGGLSDDSIEVIARRSVPGDSPDPTSLPSGIPESARPPGKVAWDESRVPVPLDPIVGRDALVASVLESVRAGRRLTTLRGPGGVGKTRVALEVARRVAAEDGASVVFADLAEATSGSEMMVGIANALGYGGPDPGNPAEVAKTLGQERVVLVCDNLEQLAADTTPLHRLLEAAPALVALVTSRTKLGLPGEDVIVVPPLELGASQTTAEGSSTSPAVEMFLQVARHGDPGFATAVHELAYVDRVCRALDGLPLALELAASRSAVMSPSQLWERVGSPVAQTSIRPGTGRRHSSVEATIAWSLSLLSPEAAAGFARLGVFTGGFTLEAVEQVCAADDESAADVDQWLAELVDASVVQSADAPSGRRFFMLQLLLAEARRRSSHPDLDRRHATFYAELAEARRPDLIGPSGAAVTKGLADDLANWSQALGWAARHDPHLYCRLARGWRPVWVTTARPAEMLASPLSSDSRASLTTEESAALDALSAIAGYLAGASGALDGFEIAAPGSAALAPDPELLVMLWSFHAAARVQAGDKDGARDAATLARAYADELGDAHDQSVANDVSGWVARAHGDLTAARTFAERSIELAEAQDDDVGVCFALNTLGLVLMEEGDVDALLACAERMLAMVEQGHGVDTNQVQGEFLLRMAHVMVGDWPAAASSLLVSLTRREVFPVGVIGDVLTAAAVLSAAGRLDDAQRALARTRQLATRFEVDISEPEGPLREHLARLDGDGDTDSTLADAEGDSSPLVPPSLLEALRRVAENPAQ